MNDRMKCEEYHGLLEEWLLGELEGSEDHRMEEHFSRCHECAVLAEETAEFLSHARNGEEATPSHATMEGMYDRMMMQMEQERVFTLPTIPRKGELVVTRRTRPHGLAIAAALFFALITAGAISSRIHQTDRGTGSVEYQVTNRASSLVPNQIHAPIKERQRQIESAFKDPMEQ
ncbi:MAG: zf-HC2 domain-containing protein [Candidatus Sumerlaeia bacterium]|nr:zf-HC2 domain-containing protein [Candidatus Sumerlaeia bacterium]